MSMIPAGWRRSHLSDVVELHRGFDLPARERRAGDVPVLTSGEVGDWHDEARVSGPGFVVGRATNLGRPKWSDIDFWPHNTTMYARDFKGNHPRWLFHLFETTDLTGFDSGSVQPMLNRNYIAQVNVVVPPFAEQQAIAEVLGALDDKIAANEHLTSQAERLAAELVPMRGTRMPLSALVTHRKDTCNPARMSDEVVSHFSLPAFDAFREPDRTPPTQIQSNKFVVSKPSVLVSKLNPRFPRAWEVLPDADVTAVASTEFLVLEPTACSTEVLWAVLSGADFWTSLEGKVAGTSGSHQRVRPADLLATEVPDPTLFGEVALSQIESLVQTSRAARAESRTLAALRDTLLPQLMSGGLRVRDAEKVVSDAV